MDTTGHATEEQLHQLARGFQISAAIYAATRLGIPDLLAHEPRTCAELAAATGTRAPALTRLMRTLAAFGMVREVGPERFALLDAAASFRADHPYSIRPLVLFWGSENVWKTWGMLADCVESGVTANGVLTGEADPNAYRARHPEAAALFHDAMTARVRPIAAALANVYDFSTVDSIVDIGGGHGQLLISLLTTHPRLRGVVFDLPTVVDGARRAAVMAGVAERLDVIGGSMFERVPPGADVYLMSSILHDWADAEVLTSLRRTRDAMTALSRLLILECFLPQPGDRSAAAQAQQLDDLNMLVRTGGRSRHESELRGLLDKAGLRVSSVRPIGFARSLVEAVRRA